MIYQAVIEVAEGTNVFATDEETGSYLIGDDVFATLALLEPEWPDVQTFPATRIAGGRQLVHALLRSDSDDPATEIDSMIAIFGLDWTLHSLDTPHYHLPYDADGAPILTDVEVDTGEVDEEGNPITVTEQQHVAEQVIERELPKAVMLQFMADEYDDSDPPVASRPTVAKVPHVWAGLLPVALEP